MPDRPVVAISGDGSAMYSIQALWTAAHHKLAIVFVILANRQYRILKHNVDIWRQNFEAGTQHPYQHMDLTGPELDFVHLAAGMGVEGVRVDTADDIAPALAKAVAARSALSGRDCGRRKAVRAIRRLLHSARAKAHAQSANRLSGLCLRPIRAECCTAKSVRLTMTPMI